MNPEGFLEDLQIERGLSPATLRARRSYLGMFLKALPRPLEECTTRDVKIALSKCREKYTPNTFGMLLYITNIYLSWENLPNIDLEELKKIRAPGKDRTTKTPGQILTQEEVTKILNAAGNSRDRAILSVLYEGGLRPIEVVRLTWDNVKIDQDGAVISVDSRINQKTGKGRYIRLINSAALLATWKYDYPGKDIESGPVFLKLRGKEIPITVNVIRKVLENAAGKAGCTKHVHPYLFRHTRVTHMLEAEVPENVIKLQHWGSLSTPMLATYGHISNEAVDKILLGMSGVKRAPERKKKLLLQPLQCPDCEFVNPPGARFCMSCGYPFTEGDKDVHRQLNTLMRDPQVLRKFADFLEQEKKE